MKKEYGIYCIVSNACPYISKVFDNLISVDEFFDSITKHHDRYHRLYYVDYGGYKNKYPKEIAQFYYKVVERPINEWQDIA